MILKFVDLIKYKTAQIMYKARYNMLKYNENDKGDCFCVCGVKLWSK